MKTSNCFYNLEKSMDTLGEMFDFAVNNCKLNGDEYWDMFICSGIAQQFENNNPKFVAGKSGEEIVHDVLSIVGKSVNETSVLPRLGRTPEYWVGWALSQYQYEEKLSYKSIHQIVNFDELINMYKTLHEAPIEKFIEVLNSKKNNCQTNLKLQRERMGLSQSQLADLSGVNVKTIQAYEQRQKEIKSAKYETLQKLSSALGCEISDFL
ncbi:MAG: helix-turn-helix domain-containing protein [Eubacterium sp.]